MATTIDSADDFDHAYFATPATLRVIARFVREHDADAHITRDGRVLLRDRDGAIKSVRTLRAAAAWLGY